MNLVLEPDTPRLTDPASGIACDARARGRVPSGSLIVRSAILILLLGLATFTVTVWSTSGYLVWSDGLPYFLFARSAVVDLDTDITNEYRELDERFPEGTKLMVPLRDWAKHDPETGRVFLPWPPGSGLVMAPFYLLGYGVELVVAAAVGRPADSYGLIPQYFYGLGSLAYGLLGFWVTFLLCRRVSGDRIAYLSTLAVVLGGPALFYIFFNPSMAHAASFGLVSLLVLWWWRQWHEGSSAAGMAVMGLLVGVLITIRYQTVLFGLLPLALVLSEMRRLPATVLGRRVLAALGAFLVPVALLALHHYLYGFSSENPGPYRSDVVLLGSYPLDLKSPFFFHVLLSCRHGAFYWAPVLGLGFLGLCWAAYGASWARVLSVTFLIQVYLIGAFVLPATAGQTVVFEAADWNHHWSGTPMFGMRYLTECAPFLALGLALAIRGTLRRVGALAWTALLAGLVIWNGLLIMGYGLGTISRSYCASYGEMAAGVLQALTKIVASL